MFTKTVLSTLDAAALTRAANRVYEDYVVPFHMSEEQAASHVATNDIRLDASPLWLDAEGGVAGLGFLGVRGKRGWVGGFGIAPAHRGQRLSHALAGEMLERAAALGLSAVQLEVITRNPHAVRTYLRAGFVQRRDLRVFVRSPRLEAPAEPAGLFAADPGALLAAAPAVTATRRAAPPCWQREPASILLREGYHGLALGDPGDPRAFVIYALAPTVVRVAHLFAPDPADLGVLTDALGARHPALGIAVVNEPEGSAYCPALEALGFEERLRQHEMIATLGA
jgi:GNAT superfamily N-acetyltransferase